MAKQQDNQNSNPAKPKTIRPLHMILATLAILLACFILYRHMLSNEVRSRLAEIQAAGQPITFNQLNKWYTIPKNTENAADLITDAAAYNKKCQNQDCKLFTCNSFTTGQVRFPERTASFSNKENTHLAQLITDNAKTLELLHKASNIKHCRFPVDYNKGYHTSLRHLDNVRQMSRLLQVQTILNAQNGHQDQAIDSIRSIFALAYSFSNDPSQIPQLLSNLCKDDAVTAIELALNRTQFADHQLAELDNTIATCQNYWTMQRGIVGERCFGNGFYEMPASELLDYGSFPHPEPINYALIAFFRLSGISDVSRLKYLDIMSDYIQLYQLPTHKRLKAVTAIDIRSEDDFTYFQRLICAYISPLHKTVLKELNLNARLRSARTAIAAQRYYHRIGQYPQTLSQLTPEYLTEIPSDPFTGKDLFYKKLDNGIVIYSKGQNSKDDQAIETTKSTDPKYDPSFRIGN